MSEYDLMSDIHELVSIPDGCVESAVVRGSYEYYHYICDGLNDKGWGCGYRSLQTLCSWVRHQLNEDAPQPVPDLHQIQQTLVGIGDKPTSFVKSREWIGSYESCLCIDQLYNVCCKILHVTTGAEVQDKALEILMHFKSFGSPVMIGGDTDCSSKTLLGICKVQNDKFYFLISDPHFVGVASPRVLLDDGWLKWRKLEDVFDKNSFYNFCLPQLRKL
ncbi:ufm1-specific protease 1 isoform X2 [Nematostella vectensis]|uniref:ufm1-specific protease 1 isoform X2 n=1 Tax=Nematostella vectensis TaxID=45351 RepID=UPI002076FE6C|nr:ufm1-specific protease 1 isoform X2 [Nematostella vectensis]